MVGMKMKIVGVDPALRNFGIVRAEFDISSLELDIKSMELVKSESDKKTAKVVRKNSDDLNRAKLLHEGFQRACEGASIAFIEVPVGSQSARAMASYGICIGILASCPISMIQVTPTEVKLAGTKIKTATKDEMIEAAVAAYPLAPWLQHRGKLTNDNEHLADALFAIKAGMATDEFKGILATAKMLRAV